MSNKKLETSKIILYMILTLTVITVLVSIVVMFKFNTYEPLSFLIPSIFGELASATFGYYWKSKNENRIKMVLSAIKEINTNDDLTEYETRIAEALISSLNS